MTRTSLSALCLLLACAGCTPKPAGSRVIEGTCFELVESNGEIGLRPLGNATVWPAGQDRYTGRTGSDGKFRLEGLSNDATLSLRAEAPGYARGGTLPLPASATQVRVLLVSQQMLHRLGQTRSAGAVVMPTTDPLDLTRGLLVALVKDAETDSPLGGARVGLLNSLRYSYVFGRGPKMEAPPGGVVLLDGLPAKATVRVIARGYDVPDLELATEAGVVLATEILAERAAPLPPPLEVAPARYADRSWEVGVHMKHSPRSDKLNRAWPLPGVVARDLDGDADVDLFFTNDSEGLHALYLNDGTGHFTDVTAQSGLTLPTASGACAADLDGDALPELYLVGGALGPGNSGGLYRNLGGGRFERRSMSPDSPQLGATCAFFDFDGDGSLELVVSGGVMGRIADKGQVFIYSQPMGSNFGSPLVLDQPTGTVWAIAPLDYDADGKPDLLTGNDFGALRMFRNTSTGSGDLSFELVDVGLASMMFPEGGWMGFALGDYDADGAEDFFSTNVSDARAPFAGGIRPGLSMNALGRLDPETKRYQLRQVDAGVADTGWSWGTEFFDADNDGRLDLYVVSNYFLVGYGYMIERAYTTISEWGELITGGDFRPAALFFNRGDGTFNELARAAGADLLDDTRAVAVADLDNDGQQDLIVTRYSASPVVLMASGATNRWLKILAVGSGNNRDAVGAKVTIRVGDQTQFRILRAGSGYISQSELRAHFGLGSADQVDELRVQFPSGVERVVAGPIAANQTVVVNEVDPLP